MKNLLNHFHLASQNDVYVLDQLIENSVSGLFDGYTHFAEIWMVKIGSLVKQKQENFHMLVYVPMCMWLCSTKF